LVFAAFVVLPPSADAGDQPCSDFSNQAQAQSYFATKGGPSSDPKRLDADGDGEVCDALPCPCAKSGWSRGPRATPRARQRRKARVFKARVSDVVDGDTIKIRTVRRHYTVRLIGIDAPEARPRRLAECGGREATSRMLYLTFNDPADYDGDGLYDSRGGDGLRVRVETDPTQPRHDRDGRLLAYVSTPWRSLARGELDAGWAKVYSFGKRFRAYRRFHAAERTARSRRRGVWDKCGGHFHTRLRAARLQRSS
jgi:endonuclease YncB( thermonuclease family)